MNREMRRAEKKNKGNQYTTPEMKKAIGACALLSQLVMCRPHDAGPIPGDGSDLASYAIQVRTRSINNVNMAMLRLTEGISDQIDDAMILSEAMGVSVIRAIEIAGPDAKTNPVLHALHQGQKYLQNIVKRHEKWQKWEMIGAERENIALAIEWYVDIITNSTPQQMEGAMGTRLRMRELAKQGKIPTETN